MQTDIDATVLSNSVTIALSIIMATYLIKLWYTQEQRLNTDLPLMFGITFVAQAVNNVIRILPMIGLVEMSMLLFKIRSMVIIGTSFPLLGVVLHIWFPRYQRHHIRMLGALMVYWITVVVVGTTEEMIILLVMPIILTLTIGMLVTFSVTWKTGRLKEVRSDLMVLSFVIGIASQVFATNILLNNLFTALATTIATLGLVNPWKSRDSAFARAKPPIQDVSHVSQSDKTGLLGK
ncbi:MAG: hypothetical protein ACW99U_08390 [Candidatus Thorarchaeota archaeon]|jgi:hypothetical protein